MSNMFDAKAKADLVNVIRQKEHGLRSQLELIGAHNTKLAVSTSQVEATALEAGINQAFGAALSEREVLATVRSSLAGLDYVDEADITAFGAKFDTIIDASIPNDDTLSVEDRDARLASVSSRVTKAAAGLAILNG